MRRGEEKRGRRMGNERTRKGLVERDIGKGRERPEEEEEGRKDIGKGRERPEEEEEGRKIDQKSIV